MLADLQSLSQPSDRFLLPPRALQLHQQRQPDAQLRTSFRHGGGLGVGGGGQARTGAGDGPGPDTRRGRGRAGGRGSDDDDADAAGGGGGGGLQQPRPYYYRIQRSVATGIASRGAGTGDGGGSAALWPPGLAGSRPSAPSDPALAARRAVYEDGRWALPLPAASGSSSSGSGSGGSGGGGGGGGGGSRAQLWRAAGGQQLQPAQERRLGEWLTRELRALLLEEDVAIVSAFVLGLVRSYGLPGGAAAAAGGGRQAAAPPLLRPFLFDHAEQFWHELGAFSVSGLPLAGYDARVQYGRRGQGAGGGSSLGVEGGQRGSSRERQPRWDRGPGGAWQGRELQAAAAAAAAGVQGRLRHAWPQEGRQLQQAQLQRHEQQKQKQQQQQQQQQPVVTDSPPVGSASAGAPAAEAATPCRAPPAVVAPAARGGGGLLKRAALEAARRLQALQARPLAAPASPGWPAAV
jgi:hypothetical protein